MNERKKTEPPKKTPKTKQNKRNKNKKTLCSAP